MQDGAFIDGKRYRFGEFEVRPAERQLRRGDALVALNSRYLDALLLLLREPEALVTKDRFMAEVWGGVPVTDEALTQCITTLRRKLGDSVGRPRFIATVPKHGYRFIAPVSIDTGKPADLPKRSSDWHRRALLGAAGTVGAGLAGLTGGLFYGFVGASQPLAPGMGAASMVVVMSCLCIAVALIAGLGVAVGIASAGFRASRWSIVGGAAGGLIVGGLAKLVGLDAFTLLIGRSPGNFTGATEGLVIGAAMGFATWVTRTRSVRFAVVTGGVSGAGAGAAITALSGRLMAGSLDLLSRQMPGARLQFDRFGALWGGEGFGKIAQVSTGTLEGAVFGAFLLGAMQLARRQLSDPPRQEAELRDAARPAMEGP